MINFTTADIVKDLEYFDTPPLFFSHFKEAWANVKSQVLKFESRMDYNVDKYKSFELWKNGDLEPAKSLIYEDRKIDLNLYERLNSINVDFIRCRPVKLPLSPYLEWVLYCYLFNSNHGEKIYFIDQDSNKELLNIALHDFMIFDSSIAVIHNFSEDGVVIGGWKTNDPEIIDKLIWIFSLIRSRSLFFKKYLDINGIKIE